MKMKKPYKFKDTYLFQSSSLVGGFEKKFREMLKHFYYKIVNAYESGKCYITGSSDTYTTINGIGTYQYKIYDDEYGTLHFTKNDKGRITIIFTDTFGHRMYEVDIIHQRPENPLYYFDYDIVRIIETCIDKYEYGELNKSKEVILPIIRKIDLVTEEDEKEEEMRLAKVISTLDKEFKKLAKKGFKISFDRDRVYRSDANEYETEVTINIKLED